LGRLAGGRYIHCRCLISHPASTSSRRPDFPARLSKLPPTPTSNSTLPFTVQAFSYHTAPIYSTQRDLQSTTLIHSDFPNIGMLHLRETGCTSARYGKSKFMSAIFPPGCCRRKGKERKGKERKTTERIVATCQASVRRAGKGEDGSLVR